MLLVFVVFIYLLISFALYKVHKKSLLLIILNLFVFASTTAYLGESLMPGKPDQQKYIAFGEACHKNSDISVFKNIHKKAEELHLSHFQFNFAFPLLSCLIHRNSDHPVTLMRLVNLMLHLLIALLSFYSARNFFQDDWLAKKTMWFVGLLPSLWAFDLYYIREVQIVFLTSLFLFSISWIVVRKSRLAFLLIIPIFLMIF